MSGNKPGKKPHEIVMPQLGLSMDSGQIVQWLKTTGETVQQGEILLEIESDKSVVEVEAVTSGRLQIVLGPEAGQVKVGEVVGYLLAEEQAPVAAGVLAPPPMSQPAVLVAEPAAALRPGPGLPALNTPPNGRRRLPSTPAARRRAAELGLDWRLAVASGLRGQIREQDVLALSTLMETSAAAVESIPEPEIAISPVARRLAEATGVDLKALARAYPGRRLEREDVETALRQATAGGRQVLAISQPEADLALSSAATQPTWPLDEIHRSLPARRVPVSLLRRTVAERMAASAHIGAAVTLMTKADASEMVRLRDALKQRASLSDGEAQESGKKLIPSYNVLLVALTSRALAEYPDLNAALNGEEVFYWETVNMGVAVDTPRGLVVPVLRDTATKSVDQLAFEAEDLLMRAATGKALPDELSGGTFTITNLGVQEIDFFTPIINPPQCAVLGVGRLTKEWILLDDDQPAARTMLPLSLTFDHRLVDGAPAARFLKRVKQFVEQPYLWLR